MTFIAEGEQSVKKRSLTQEIGMLPPTDQIAKRIEDDANELADCIKDKLVEAATESKDGRITVESALPVLYQDRVVAKLQSWAKMQNYRLGYDHGKFSLAPKGVKFEGKGIKLCKECKNIRHAHRENMQFILGGVGCFGIGVGVALSAAFMGSSWWWLVPAFFLSIFAGSWGYGSGKEEGRRHYRT